MRSARDVAGAVMRCTIPTPNPLYKSEVLAAANLIEADRRAAKLECLRDAYDRCFKELHMVGALNAIQAMIASLETEAAEPAKEET